MSLALRVVLIAVSVLVTVFVLFKIRKAQLNIDDSLYWIFFAFFLVLLSLFPGIAIWASELLGILSPANFVFLFIIFVVLIKLFDLSIDLSVQKHRLNHLVQKLALMQYRAGGDAPGAADLPAGTGPAAADGSAANAKPSPDAKPLPDAKPSPDAQPGSPDAPGNA